MKPQGPERPVRRNHRALLRWHRRVGVTLAALFVVVGITGILLNHSEGLELRSRAVQADWLFRWYDMQPPGEPTGFQVDDTWLVAVGASVYLGETLAVNLEDVVGAVLAGDVIAVASPQQIVLLTRRGEVIERLTDPALPPGAIRNVGISGPDARAIVRTDRGIYEAESGFLGWQPTAPGAARWSEPSSVPASITRAVLSNYRGEGLNLHRVLLDLHSGRFFGKYGTLVVDGVAVGLLFLIVSGAWYAFAARRNGR